MTVETLAASYLVEELHRRGVGLAPVVPLSDREVMLLAGAMIEQFVTRVEFLSGQLEALV